MGSTSQPQGPSPSERLLFDVWDACDAARLRAGEQEATRLAKRALSALQGDDTVNDVQKVDWLFKTQSPEAIIAGLQGLRDQAERDGNFDAAEGYGQAIRGVISAGGGVADDEEDADELDDEPADLSGRPTNAPQLAAAAKMAKLTKDDIRKNQVAVTNQIAKGYRGLR